MRGGRPTRRYGRGGLSALDVRATATGSQAGQPLALDTVATVDLSGTRKTVRVAQLSGKAPANRSASASRPRSRCDGADGAWTGSI